jgi:xylan 1,4-beta-xylosidase
MNTRLTLPLFIFLCVISILSIKGQTYTNPKTFCNPLNLEYRFSLTEKDVREAADPVIVLFKDDYYLFASKLGGYWVSEDLSDWKLIIPSGLPLEDYAPAVFVFNDTMYYTAFNTGKIF